LGQQPRSRLCATAGQSMCAFAGRTAAVSQFGLMSLSRCPKHCMDVTPENAGAPQTASFTAWPGCLVRLPNSCRMAVIWFHLTALKQDSPVVHLLHLFEHISKFKKPSALGNAIAKPASAARSRNNIPQPRRIQPPNQTSLNPRT
jgi:hypothetical protein